MNVIQAIQDYVSKMLANIPGLKVFLLDKETLLQKEVYLFERIDVENREQMPHLKAVCFLRPTRENLEQLKKELKEPKYGEYHIFFSNTIGSTYIELLAEADEHEVVHQLQEYFADYYAANVDGYTLNLNNVFSVQQPNWRSVLDRSVDGLASVLLSLKKQPYIRFSGRSDMCQKVVNELQRRVSQEPGLYDFRKSDVPPLLLVLDRRDDPVTPLLSQWTYQAMVHELLGIQNNRVSLQNAPGIKKELQEIVLSGEQDPFFKQSMYLNFGDLGVSIKNLVDEYGKKTQTTQNIESMEDIKRFVENYPEFKKLSGNVSKHVTLMGELSRLIEQRNLLEVAELEQEMANNEDHATQIRALQQYLQDPKFTPQDKVRLAMLYALRYETHTGNEINNVMNLLQSKAGIEQENVMLIRDMLNYAGASARTGDVFGNKNVVSKWGKSIKRGLKGVQNIYTEHKPLLKQVLENVQQNKLKESEYPFAYGTPTRAAPNDIIVFMVGGTTYEEALTVHDFNSNKTYSTRAIVGGTCIHSSASFIEDASFVRTLQR